MSEDAHRSIPPIRSVRVSSVPEPARRMITAPYANTANVDKRISIVVAGAGLTTSRIATPRSHPSHDCDVRQPLNLPSLYTSAGNDDALVLLVQRSCRRGVPYTRVHLSDHELDVGAGSGDAAKPTTDIELDCPALTVVNRVMWHVCGPAALVAKLSAAIPGSPEQCQVSRSYGWACGSGRVS
jgi:hypothetical protein